MINGPNKPSLAPACIPTLAQSGICLSKNALVGETKKLKTQIKIDTGNLITLAMVWQELKLKGTRTKTIPET